jgi:hypothetical protein
MCRCGDCSAPSRPLLWARMLGRTRSWRRDNPWSSNVDYTGHSRKAVQRAKVRVRARLRQESGKVDARFVYKTEANISSKVKIG